MDLESEKIASVADEIVNSQVTCSSEEKMELKEQKAALDKVITKAQASLEEVQDKLEELTGTTRVTVTSASTPGNKGIIHLISTHHYSLI